MMNSPYSHLIASTDVTRNTNFSEKAGFKKIGIHQIGLAPHGKMHPKENSGRTRVCRVWSKQTNSAMIGQTVLSIART
jgi:hypothetical protein